MGGCAKQVEFQLCATSTQVENSTTTKPVVDLERKSYYLPD
ncbi:hypothetical protein An08g08970 [Aspergillus niger]|uniref:Uncharacterized protein n=2 Tax=Aspergillus niger TaxID=5061 RepID=A5AB42_ASPNC|nr:hypothetical protein An08g08970 [Aspergillus niger]CAK96676.1 hypothetical protein An08g08970 [Aspergillus niger]